MQLSEASGWATCFSVTALYRGRRKSELRPATDAKPFVDRFTSLWKRTDSLFGIVASEAMLSQPIALRHPFIF
jgi:hypothetical protein